MRLDLPAGVDIEIKTIIFLVYDYQIVIRCKIIGGVKMKNILGKKIRNDSNI